MYDIDMNNCPVENLLLIAEACLLGRASHKALDFQNSRFHDLSWWEVYRLSTSQSNITLIYNVHANLRSLRIEAEIINTYIHIYIILYIYLYIYTHLYPSQVLQLQLQDTTSPGPKSKCTMASPQWLGWMDGSVVFTKIPCYIDAKLQPPACWWLICVILWYPLAYEFKWSKTCSTFPLSSYFLQLLQSQRTHTYSAYSFIHSPDKLFYLCGLCSSLSQSASIHCVVRGQLLHWEGQYLQEAKKGLVPQKPAKLRRTIVHKHKPAMIYKTLRSSNPRTS